MDLPQQERWNEIAADFKDQAYLLEDYLKDNLPTWAYPIAVQIGEDIEPYFKAYGDEMIGLASALNVDLGVIVALNLAYQLERIGVTCSNWNNTGPTLSDDAIPRGLSCAPDGVDLTPNLTAATVVSEEQVRAFEVRRAARRRTGPDGQCTSIVTQGSAGAMLHGRNLDWNIPESLKPFVVDVAVHQNGALLYRGTTAVGFVGMLNGLHVGADAGGGSDPTLSWTVSQDARNHGGRIPLNLLQALRTGALTPEQALRSALESSHGAESTVGGFEAAVTYLQDVAIVDDVYYVMAGGSSDHDAAVVTRQRNGPRDVWRLGTDATQSPHQAPPLPPPSANWWLTETNYDHWEQPPQADNRRDPANLLMASLGSAAGTSPNALLGVMSTWPVFNPHTTFTTLVDFATGAYNSTVWYGNSP